MKYIVTAFFMTFSLATFANTSEKEVSQKQTANKKDVVENPTLKTLSGSLNKYSLYSSFTYKGGSLKDPISADRPNILNAQEKSSLASLSGNFGVKYRLTKSDNLSLQLGVYSTTPFHSSFKAEDSATQRKFDENHQNVDFDDPTISYFKTYHIGQLQNISFVKFQWATRGVYRDNGLRAAAAYSHAAAYKINKYAYVAATMTYENYIYDKSETIYKGYKLSLKPYQTQHTLRGNISTEFYVKRNMAFRLITDVFSLFQMKDSAEIEDRKKQQTIAMTYFFSRDISIAPSVKFVASDMRADRTNIGMTLNVNL